MEERNDTFPTSYDFHIRPDARLHICAEFESILRCKGFIFLLTSYRAAEHSWRLNYYGHEPPVNIRIPDYDFARSLFLTL